MPKKNDTGRDKFAKSDKIISQLSETGYKIPEWCRMSPREHADGMGGCWGILFGHVEKEGESYCQECEFHKAEAMVERK